MKRWPQPLPSLDPPRCALQFCVCVITCLCMQMIDGARQFDEASHNGQSPLFYRKLRIKIFHQLQHTLNVLIEIRLRFKHTEMTNVNNEQPKVSWSIWNWFIITKEIRHTHTHENIKQHVHLNCILRVAQFVDSSEMLTQLQQSAKCTFRRFHLSEKVLRTRNGFCTNRKPNEHELFSSFHRVFLAQKTPFRNWQINPMNCGISIRVFSPFAVIHMKITQLNRTRVCSTRRMRCAIWHMDDLGAGCGRVTCAGRYCHIVVIVEPKVSLQKIRKTITTHATTNNRHKNENGRTAVLLNWTVNTTWRLQTMKIQRIISMLFLIFILFWFLQ